MDFLHLFKRHNPPDQVMSYDMVRLLGYLDVLDFCTRHEEEKKAITRDFKKFLSEIREPLAKNTFHCIRNVLGNIISEALPGGLFTVDDIDADFKEAFESIALDKINDPVDFSFDFLKVVYDVTSEVMAGALADSAKIGLGQTGEAFADLGTGGIYGIVKNIIEASTQTGIGALASTAGAVIGVANVVLTVVKIGFSGVVIPVAHAVNKKNNLKRYLETEKNALDKKREGQRRDKGRVDRARMERVNILRSILKTNAVMGEWKKGYLELNKEIDKLKKVSTKFSVRNCYDAYYAMRQLLIVREKYCAAMTKHQMVREYHRGIIVKFRKMALKNSLRAHRLYNNGASYFNAKGVVCAAPVCYHPQGTNKKTIHGTAMPSINTTAIDMKLRKGLFDSLVFFDEQESKKLIGNFRKVMEGEDASFKKIWEKHAKEILAIKSTRVEPVITDRELTNHLRDALKKRRRDMMGR